MIPDPFRRSGQYETAELRSREGHDEQRRDTRQYLREGACPRPGQRQNDGRHERDHHVAHEAVCSHRRDIGPEHPSDHHRGHRHGRQHTDHRPLCHDGIERQQQEIDRHAHHNLKQQQPQVQHRRLHLPGLDAAERKEEHQENQRGCNHLLRPPLEGGHGAAKQRPGHHGRRHGDGLDIAVQVFQYVHYFMVSIVRTTCCPEAVPIPHTVPSSGSGSSRNRQTSPSQGCPSSERMLVLLIGLFVQVNTRVDLLGDSGYEEIYVPKGERLQMMFQDGTRAYINSDSRLKYPKKFALSSREVYLEGEAYFVVSKNSHRPFIVNLNGPAVHVLGTSFDVQAYPENKDITVCLDEGRVNLTLASDKKYPLKPGEKLVYNKESEHCTITRHADIHLSSLWKKNVIAFKDAPLAEVIKVLNRWYDVDFKIEDQSAWDVYFTITSENTLLEKVLGDLEKIAPLRFEYKEAEKEVIVTRKKEDSRLMH